MADKISIGLSKNIRIYVVSTKETLLEAVKRHNLWPIATQALSRVLSITAIMGKMLKEKQKVVSIVNGGGMLGTIMAESDSQGNIRGYVANPSLGITYNKDKKISIAHAVGKNGYVKIIKDLGMKKPFTAQVAMVDGEISMEFTHYFLQSEQINTTVLVDAILDKEEIVASSGAIVFQLMPNHNQEDVKEVKNMISKINLISQLLQFHSPEGIIKIISPNANVLETSKIRFNCQCDINKMQLVIKTLGNQEIKKLIKEGWCEIKCQFCSKIEIFNKEQLKKLL